MLCEETSFPSALFTLAVERELFLLILTWKSVDLDFEISNGKTKKNEFQIDFLSLNYFYNTHDEGLLTRGPSCLSLCDGNLPRRIHGKCRCRSA